jgi:hypothetical protein
MKAPELTKEEDLKSRVGLLELVFCLELISVIEGLYPHIVIINPKLKNQFIISHKEYRELYGKEITPLYEVLHKVSSDKYKLYTICLNEKRILIYIEHEINVNETVYNSLYIEKLLNEYKYLDNLSVGTLKLSDGTVIEHKLEDNFPKRDYKFVRYIKYPNSLIESYIPLSQEYNYYIFDIIDTIVSKYSYYTKDLYELYI